MAEEDPKLNVIRIKRKRGEEPVTSLLVEVPAPKKSYIDSFKALSTTDKDPPKTAEPKVFCLVGTVSSHDPPTRLKEKIKEAQQKRKLLLRTNTQNPEKSTDAQKELSKQQKAARSKEIKLLRTNEKKENSEYADLFHLVDLVKADDDVQSVKKSNNNNNNNIATSSNSKKKEKEEDELLCNYMPMVREYLKTDQPSTQSKGVKESNNNEEEEEDDDEYVYDVYYTDDTVAAENKSEMIVARIESFNEGLDSDNEYDDGDTDSDDEENRVTDIYPDEDEDPDFEDEYGSSSENYSDSSNEYGYDQSDEDDDEDERRLW